ncbi:preprotein translocase subunit SecG [Candidatus Paracaedibacter symbiosus]|uniref:preprotein translocase subunit SecG n=1 Tax=Candidatus Paracaedibacter symbiosus TaxID=244582 RepID=UPI00050955F3|nr:preprotein translocase subunit SecG [Candidatus Paracaedibacter symbiosus]
MNVLLFIHVIITLALIGVILIQRSEGGGLGLGSGGSSSNNMFSARGTANLLTRVTGVLATLFFLNCLLMGAVAKRQINQTSSILSTSGDMAPPSLPETPKN